MNTRLCPHDLVVRGRRGPNCTESPGLSPLERAQIQRRRIPLAPPSQAPALPSAHTVSRDPAAQRRIDHKSCALPCTEPHLQS